MTEHPQEQPMKSPLLGLALHHSPTKRETEDSEVKLYPEVAHHPDNQNRPEKGKRHKNVPQHLWEKFKSLEKRTNETVQRSTEKRIKHLQKKVMETVTKEFTLPEDKDILREHDVKFGPPVKSSRKRKVHVETHSEKDSPSSSTQKAEIMSLLSVNDHLILTDHSRPPPETALEKQISDAIQKGDVKTAEDFSDRLASLQAGEKLANAFDAKRYLEQKQREKETAFARKKKKLSWGFEPKQRWETKGNM